MIAFLAGAVCGAAVLGAVLRPYLDRKIADESRAAYERGRQVHASVLTELAAEFSRLQSVHLFTPYPKHAPMRSAFAKGFRRGMWEAQTLAMKSRAVILRYGDADQPPERQVARLFVGNPATKEA